MKRLLYLFIVLVASSMAAEKWANTPTHQIGQSPDPYSEQGGDSIEDDEDWQDSIAPSHSHDLLRLYPISLHEPLLDFYDISDTTASFSSLSNISWLISSTQFQQLFDQVYQHAIISNILNKKTNDTTKKNLNIIPDLYAFDTYQKGKNAYLHGDTSYLKTVYDVALFRKGLFLRIDRALENASLSEGVVILGELPYDYRSKNPLIELNFSSNLKKFDMDWEKVRNSLHDNDIAIEFIQFFSSGTYELAALKLKKNYKYPQYIPIGNTEQLIPLENEDIDLDSLWYCSSLIDTLIWDKILGDELTHNEKYRVSFAADGDLHYIAIENTPLMMERAEHFELHRVASTREIVDGQQPLDLRDAALFGDIAYNASPDEVAMANTTLQHPQEFRVPPMDVGDLYARIDNYESDVKKRGGRGSMYDPLPHSAEEIVSAAAMLSRAGAQCHVFDKARATEEAFNSLDGHSPSVLHLATHGLYVEAVNVEVEREYWNLPFMDHASQRATAEDAALTHSFLTMAGSRYRDSLSTAGLEDGHLTAQEISRMDLHNTRLVVLSACESALGDVSSEGVLGLQRGFKRAGAGTIVMAVRKVGDAPAKDFMVTFYDELAKQFKQKHDDHNALRNAFSAARNRIRHDYPNSLDWAYFIMLD